MSKRGKIVIVLTIPGNASPMQPMKIRVIKLDKTEKTKAVPKAPKPEARRIFRDVF